MADGLVGALTGQVFGETKRTGRAAGKKNELPNEKEDVLKGTEREKKTAVLKRWRSSTFDHLARWATTTLICIFRAAQHSK